MEGYIIEINGIEIKLPSNVGQVVIHSKEGSISATIDAFFDALKNSVTDGVVYEGFKTSEKTA